MGEVSDAYVRAALSTGAAMLHRRMAEVAADIASHEAEMARLTCEHDSLADQLRPSPLEKKP